MSPKLGGGGGCGVSANEYRCAHGAQINVGDLTPYLTCEEALQNYQCLAEFTEYQLMKSEEKEGMLGWVCNCICAIIGLVSSLNSPLKKE